MSDTNTIPTDVFSRRRRELMDNPGAIRSASTVNLQDFYGNTETWNIETFRTDGIVEALVQRNSIDGSLRLVLPPKVMSALDRQRDQVITGSRRRAAQRAVDTKREKGIDPAAALRKHMRKEAAVRARERKAVR